MDEVASNTLATLKRSSVSAESKISAINTLKSSIKHQRIPESAQTTTVECLRLAITSQVSSSLVAAGFSALSHLVKRLTLQDQTSALFSQRANLVAILLERLSDGKEALRAASSQTMSDLWSARPNEIETKIREGAIESNNTKAKIEGMQWVTKMHEEHELQFKSFVPSMVECLEDADGTVRDSAKFNLVGLFKDARDAAKADLKRQLVAFNVRKSIAEYILSQLQVPVPKELNASSKPAQRPETPQRNQRLQDAPIEPSLPPSAEVVNIEPLYVHTYRELEDMFRQMQPCFEDREREDNWKARDNSVLKIRRLLKGNAPSDHLTVLVASVKQILDGILKVVNSLRTTMSTNGCQLVQELASTLGTAMDPMAEIILHGIEKMCAATKHIAAQNGNATVEAILSNVSYSSRFMQHVHAATSDKNVQPRQFAPGWLKIILKKHVQNKSQFEHSGGLELAEKSIKKGLADANPKVRELMRGTYWTFAPMWPNRAEAISSALDVKSKILLEKDSANPNAPSDISSFTRSVGPEPAVNPRVPTNARASLKDAIAAQRNASRRMPERPNSAMSTFTPSRQAPTPASRPASKMAPSRVVSGAHSSASSKATASSTSTTSAGHGSLMSGPVRRPRRADVPRPATADPYGGRNAIREDTPERSTIASPRQASRSGVPQPNTHKKSKSATTVGGIPSSTSSSQAGSPNTSPAKVKSKSHIAIQPHSNLRADNSTTSPPRDDNFTMIFPDGKMPSRALPSRTRNNENDRPGSGHSSQLGTVDEDNFTLVIPEKSKYFGTRSSLSAFAPEVGAVVATLPEERKDDAVMVYEDAAAEDMPIPSTEEPVVVLEEKAPNEQNHLQQSTEALAALPAPDPSSMSSPTHSANSDDQNAPHPQTISPTKKAFSPIPSRTPSPTKRTLISTLTTKDSPQPTDRAEILKARRLLGSGTDRVKACTLDAHGFRRLQELIKSHARTEDIRFAPLLAALCDYIVHIRSASSTSTSKNSSVSTKEHGLKGQALTSLRAIVSLCAARDEEVRDALPGALVSIARAAGTWDGGLVELDKTIDEIIRRIASLHDVALLEACVDTLAAFVEGRGKVNADSTNAAGAHGNSKTVSLALQELTKVLPPWSAAMDATGADMDANSVGGRTRARLARLAVKILADFDADIRRRAVDFAVVLYAVFPAQQQQQGEAGAGPAVSERKVRYWELLKPAGEQSCNLVAYYLARRGRIDVGA